MSSTKNIQMVDKKYIMETYNISDYQAGEIIRKLKQELFLEGYKFYNNKKFGFVPLKRLEAFLAIS